LVKSEKKPDIEGEFYHIYSDGKKNIGLCKMLFGVRVVANNVNSPFNDFNYCCGNDLIMINMCFNLCLNILENSRGCLHFPIQNHKPIGRDSELLTWLFEKFNEIENPKIIQIPETVLVKMRSDLISKLDSEKY